jgi:hypothetical protein
MLQGDGGPGKAAVRLDNQELLDLLKKEPRTLAEAVATTLRGIGAS